MQNYFILDLKTLKIVEYKGNIKGNKYNTILEQKVFKTLKEASRYRDYIDTEVKIN